MGYINPRIHSKAVKQGMGYDYKILWTKRNNLADEYKKTSLLKVDLILNIKELYTDGKDKNRFNNIINKIDNRLIEIDDKLSVINKEIKKYNGYFDEVDTSNEIALSSLKRLTMVADKNDDIIIMIDEFIDEFDNNEDAYKKFISVGIHRDPCKKTK